MQRGRMVLTISVMLACTSCAEWQPWPHRSVKNRTSTTAVKKPAIALETKKPDAMLLAKESAPQRVAAQQVMEQGVAALQRNDYPRALQLLQEAMTIDGSNGAVYYYLAKTHAALQQPERIEGLLERAEALLGDDPIWAERIANFKAHTGKDVI